MIKIESIIYSQFPGETRAWYLDKCSLGDINLIVGKNATGKTRTLNIIGGLGKMLSGEVKPTFLSGDYTVKFKEKGKEIVYHLEYKDNAVVRETLKVGGELLLTRRKDGKGKIRTEEMDRMMRFQIPAGELACVCKRDTVQHPFLEGLHIWGGSVRHYRFGTSLGKDSFVVGNRDDRDLPVNAKDANAVVPILRKGESLFGEKFSKNVRRDMKAVGYDLESVETGPLQSILLTGLGTASCVVVKERDLAAVTDQSDMSQGMFRCLSLIIQLTYAEMNGDATCILIDDVGEGLDYERAAALISVLIEKAKKSKVQLIMSTNDRFVMNKVPLVYWSIADRCANRVVMRNYRNSRKMFDEFELTGLSNFDLFSSRSSGTGDGQ
mgnify:CR=1 FL=1